MGCLMRRLALAFSSFPSVGWAECHGLMWGNEKSVSLVTATTLQKSWHSAGDELAVAVCHSSAALSWVLPLLHPLFWFDWKSYLGHNRKMGGFRLEFIGS